MAAVSVLLTTLDPGRALPALVRSIDAQTLPAADFELVVADASRDESAARLQQLAGRRPNVAVLIADAGATAADRLGRALERATGEYVLVLAQQQRLAPRALELLLDRARRTGADLVVGRTVTDAASGSAALPDDADPLDPSTVDVTGCCALVRRSLVLGRPDAGAALLDLPALARAATTVTGLGRQACAVSGRGGATTSSDLSLEPPGLRWADGALQLTVVVRRSGSASPAPRAWLVVVQGLAEVALPATVAAGQQGRTTVSAVLDPRTADDGRPLDDGPWDLRLRLAWPDREATVPLGPAPARSAVLDGRPYVARGASGALQLDAGAIQSSAIGPVPTSRASITESAGGTLVTFDYPTLHVQGDAVLGARMLLDGFSLPARLVCRDGRARLEAYASSLAGTSRVSVVAGGGRPVATGLRLQVDGAGAMTFSPAPPSKPADPSSVPLVQRLRHRLPGALEPTVHRLAQVPALRGAYRRLLSR